MMQEPGSKIQPCPCPFCGSADVIFTWDEMGLHIIMCKSCEACGPVADNHDTAAALWNRIVIRESEGSQ